MGFFEGLKKWFFGKRKEDKRNEPKNLKVVYKPKPSRAVRKAHKLAEGKKGRGWVRRATRQWCPGSIIAPAERETAPKAELDKHMPHWYKRQLQREALQKAFGPENPHGESVVLAAGPPMPPEVQKMLDPLAPENQPKCIQPIGAVRKEPGE